MAYTRAALPAFAPDIVSGSAFAAEGLMDTAPPEDGIGQYRRIPLVSKFSLRSDLPTGTHTIWSSTNLDNQVTVALATDQTVHRVYALIGDRFVLQAVANEEVFLFEFEEAVWALTISGQIYKFVSNVFQLQSSTLRQRLSDLGVVDSEIKSVAVWLGRVWIGARDFLVWSDDFNATEWRLNYVADSGDTLNTNAGSTQISAEGIRAIVPVGRRLVIFSEDTVFDVVTSHTEFNINIRELYRGVRYKGGGINWRGVVYFITESGVRAIQSDGSTEIVSLAIDSEVVRRIRTAESISVVGLGDLVIWSSGDHLILFNTKWGKFAPIQEQVGAVLGSFRASSRTVDQLMGTIASLEGTINEQVSPFDEEPVVISGLDLFPFRYQAEVSLSFNADRQGGDLDTLVRSFAMPELMSYSVQMRSINDTEWGEPVPADALGRCRFNERVQSPTFRLTTSEIFDTLNLYVVDAGERRAG